MEITIKKYTSEAKKDWDAFINNAKNATFLLYRDFMEYHSNRFEDYSLLVYKKKSLVAVLPANISEGVVHSHQGLTYGGLVLDKKVKMEEVSVVFSEILRFLHAEGISNLVMKLVPSIYHLLPSDEMQYLFFITEATLVRAEVTSTIETQSALKIQSNRMEGVKKAKKQDLQIKEETNFDAFWNEILIPNLKERHNASPVHSLEEINELHLKFPHNIRQFNVYNGETIVAGATIFETDKVAHTQYISANKDKQTLGSLDFLFEYLIKNRYQSKTYFDFGTSHENAGRTINRGLHYWKECFGARSIMQPVFEVKTANYIKLKEIFV